jgi:hypothetical protein
MLAWMLALVFTFFLLGKIPETPLKNERRIQFRNQKKNTSKMEKDI